MSVESLASSPVGWFGKLPAAGDFLSRALPARFVEPWDAWLRAGMAMLAQEDGAEWQEHFLRFPAWCFLRGAPTSAAPALQPIVWAGLVVPGADRVGRLFPLTVAFAVPSALFLDLPFAIVERRLLEIEDLVMDVLGDDDLDAFAAALEALPALAADAESCERRTPSTLIGHLGRQALLDRLADHALFWHASGASVLLEREPLEAATFCRLVPHSPTLTVSH